jgi:hypothetical protein
MFDQGCSSQQERGECYLLVSVKSDIGSVTSEDGDSLELHSVYVWRQVSGQLRVEMNIFPDREKAVFVGSQDLMIPDGVLIDYPVTSKLYSSVLERKCLEVLVSRHRLKVYRMRDGTSRYYRVFTAYDVVPNYILNRKSKEPYVLHRSTYYFDSGGRLRLFDRICNVKVVSNYLLPPIIAGGKQALSTEMRDLVENREAKLEFGS